MHRLLVTASLLALATPAGAVELGLPAQCAIGTDCFLQQLPDMDPGPGVADPFCGTATYQGHKGTDLRILSMKDVERAVPVVAMADGTVLRQRDGVDDRLVLSDADRAAVSDKECGNGVILDVGDGVEVQYCHMRKGSVAVQPNTSVKRGDKLGEIGASGLAAFPHVHVILRKDGKEIDPATGRGLDEGCLRNPSEAKPLFTPEVLKALGRGDVQIIGAGLAGTPFKHAQLVQSGPPEAANSASDSTVGWGWFVNLRKDDRIRIALTGPDGRAIAEQTSEPMDRSKASFSGFAGRKRPPAPGDYKVTVSVIRGGNIVAEKRAEVTVD